MNSLKTVWILGDQLLRKHPAITLLENEVGKEKSIVLMIENQSLIKDYARNPRKLILVLSAMRHYQAELNEAGFQVDYRQAFTFKQGIQDHVLEWSPEEIITMESSNYRGRKFQSSDLPGQLDIPVRLLPNTQFLVGRYDPYPDDSSNKQIIFEYFYRKLRKKIGILIDEKDQPLGGQWNFDRENRKTLPAEMPIPEALIFPPDEITRQVMKELSMSGKAETQFELATTAADALEALDEFIINRLPSFGSFEDAMASRSGLIFHSRLSPYLNLGLLDPLEIVLAVENAYHTGQAPLNSVEGFIRQVLGWREYMYWRYWKNMPAMLEENHFLADRSLPDFFWNGKTDLNCLFIVLARALQTGYNHHIERLMILTNFCTLTGLEPLAVLEWFTKTYLDAYPWVMGPNVLGMGLHADGGEVGTKPYISSANYINKMSDYCQSCSYNYRLRSGKDACPFNYLYWNFLIKHQDKLSKNPRMNLSLANLKRLDESEQQNIERQSRDFISKLSPRS